MKNVDFSGKPFHFIGVGGIGMSALAYILAKRNLPVSGSDLRSSHITERLQTVGAHIFASQQASNLEFFSAKIGPTAPTNPEKRQTYGAYKSVVLQEKTWTNLPQVICSTAIAVNNAEYQAAQNLGCPIFHRSDLLAALIQDYQSIAVAGTHGKTTTSSLMGYMLFHANLDPTIIIGGEVDAWQGNARLGKGNFLVAEADESDGSLAKHCPKIGIVTNIELDHTDHYQDLRSVIDTFQIFASQCETLIGCLDCPIVEQELCPAISYSLDPDKNADYTVKNVSYHAEGSRAEIWERGKLLGNIALKLLGKHNLSNALAVVAAARKLGLDFSLIAEAMANFTGTKRRFEKKGECQGITFIDDYAHHPSEIKATLASARLRVTSGQNQRVVAIFQPHRYSRTQTFLAEFAQCFADADLVILTDIYSAGETNLSEISGETLAQAIANFHPQVLYHQHLPSLSQFLNTILQPGDLALFLGAGNLNQSIAKTIALFSTPKNKPIY